jgi:hypothetical protein
LADSGLSGWPCRVAAHMVRRPLDFGRNPRGILHAKFQCNYRQQGSEQPRTGGRQERACTIGRGETSSVVIASGRMRTPSPRPSGRALGASKNVTQFGGFAPEPLLGKRKVVGRACELDEGFPSCVSARTGNRRGTPTGYRLASQRGRLEVVFRGGECGMEYGRHATAKTLAIESGGVISAKSAAFGGLWGVGGARQRRPVGLALVSFLPRNRRLGGLSSVGQGAPSSQVRRRQEACHTTSYWPRAGQGICE